MTLPYFFLIHSRPATSGNAVGFSFSTAIKHDVTAAGAG